jgi:hypothetical protein
MAKVTLTFTDTDDGVEFDVNFDPDIPDDLSEEQLDQLSEAQLVALDIMDYISGESEEEEIN